MIRHSRNSKEPLTMIRGTVVLQKAEHLVCKDFGAGVRDRCADLVRRRNVGFQLVSCNQRDDETEKGKVSPHKADLRWNSPDSEDTGNLTYRIILHWPSEYGTPGAILVTNEHHREFFLKHVSIYFPDEGNLEFLCDSWVFPTSMDEHCSSGRRIFFEKKSYLPNKTPKGLDGWRKEELEKVRGNGRGQRRPEDRVYDHDFYNDLGGTEDQLKRPVLGGTDHLPYPRRCRTGRNLTGTNRTFETRETDGPFYIPSDEKFPHASNCDFETHLVDAFSKKYMTDVRNRNGCKKNFSNLEEVKNLYSREHQLDTVKKDCKRKKICQTGVKEIGKFPEPKIMSGDDGAWRKDEEFARQTLSGINPMAIKRLESFPPRDNLSQNNYSSITKDHLRPYLHKMSVEEAIEGKKLFILDYYDAYMPYVERINNLPTSKVYATRTIFFLQPDETLRPIAIELCLPPTLGDKRVFTPNYNEEDRGWLWELAKAHVRSNDAGYHQLVNHWLRTHAAVEPFIIATHRNLSKLHPLHKLLLPHFRNTMDINRTARKRLINAGGIIEECFSPGQFAMEISSKAYIHWKFNEQGLPADLKRRGMATENEAGGLELAVKDYPYAVDGLEIWDALKSWVSDYTSLYYSNDQSVDSDEEVKAWWKEIREVGHGDKKHEAAGWYKMETLNDLNEAITTLIWVASAHHAAVNFGQYDYAGFMPNLPSTTRKLVPHKGSDEYSELLKDPEAYFLKTITEPKRTTQTMAVLKVLSKHFTDEVYLGQGSTKDWVDDSRVEEAFMKFQEKLLDIEKNITARNKNPNLKNRCGPAKLPYTLLFPNISDKTKTGGLTGKGIPYSIGI